MQVAIITDIPSWSDDTGYLNELEKKLPIYGIIPKIFLISNKGIYGKIGIRSYLTQLIQLTKIIKKLSKFDIIHTQFSFPLGFGCVLLKSLKLIRKPVIIHTHGVDVFTVPSINYGIRRLTLGKIFTDFAWKKADLIITTCKKAKSEIEKSGISEEKIEILYNGIDESLFKKCKNNIPSNILELRNKTDFLLLNVASGGHVKNYKMMLKVFKKILKKYQSQYNIKLAIVGKDYTMSLQKLDNQNILYLGKKDHKILKNFYNIADLFILPSLSEAHPWSILEAMSCELPVIASNVGGIPETIDDMRFLIDPYDEEDMIKKIENIIKMDHEDLKKIGVLNRKKILNQFTLDIHVKRLKQIYSRACS